MAVLILYIIVAGEKKGLNIIEEAKLCAVRVLARVQKGIKS